jgi:hypothetical protein
MRGGAELLYQFRQPHNVDAAKFHATFGDGGVTDYTDGIAQTLRWYGGNPTRSVLAIGR